MKTLLVLLFYSALFSQIEAKRPMYVALDESESVLRVKGIEELQKVVEENSFVLAFYYSSEDCSHCDQALPWFLQAANSLQNHQPPITFAALNNQDPGNDDELAQTMAIRSWFTLRIYEGSLKEFKPYKGPKYRDGMADELRGLRTGELQQESFTNKAIEEMRTAKPPPTPSTEPQDSEVITLTADNFSTVVNSHEFTLVKFYAPWCGHCKKMAPAFTEASVELKDSGIKLAKIDCTQEENAPIKDRYSVNGFPTLKLFKGNEETHVPYSGDRSKEDMIKFVTKQAGKPKPARSPQRPSTQPTKSDSAVLTLTGENFDQTVQGHDLVMVKFYAPWCGHCKKMVPAYAEAAASLNQPKVKMAELDCTQPGNNEIANRYSVRGYPTIMVFRGNQYNHVTYTGDRSKGHLLRFLQEQRKNIPDGNAKIEL